MATFESGSRTTKSSSLEKYPYKRLESSVQKILKVLEIDIDRLERHRINIKKYHATKQWKLLSKEQINSSRTVKQLKATIKQVEQVRNQVETEDLPKFDLCLGDIQQMTISAIVEFLDLPEHHQVEPLEELTPSQVEPPVNMQQSDNKDVIQLESMDQPLEGPTDADLLPGHQGELLSEQMQAEISELEAEVEASRQAEQSWEQLRMNLVELNSLVHECATVVHAQQKAVDQIEDHVTEAQINVEEGTLSLASAAKLKGAIFPVAGAVLGGVIGGPVGLVAGIKLGSLAAVTGGIAGFGSGHLLKKRQDSQAEQTVKEIQERKVETKLDQPD